MRTFLVKFHFRSLVYSVIAANVIDAITEAIIQARTQENKSYSVNDVTDVYKKANSAETKAERDAKKD